MGRSQGNDQTGNCREKPFKANITNVHPGLGWGLGENRAEAISVLKPGLQ